MADYKALRGLTIRTIAGDPDPLLDGDIWYNSSSKKIKGVKLADAAFASSNNMNTGRDFMGCAGTQTATITAGGEPPNTSKAEQYDGSSWTEVGDLVSGARYGMRGFGSTTAGLICGGYPPTSGGTVTESWNGASWTEVSDLSQARYGLIGGGTSTAALAIAGFIGGPGAPSALVEEWNGASWASGTSVNSARGVAGAGVTDTENAIFFGGATHPGTALKALTEAWDGTSWTEVGDLGTARAYVNGSGSDTSALCMGGGPGTAGGTATEEWTAATYSIKTVTTS